jgi:hypothetical protein
MLSYVERMKFAFIGSNVSLAHTRTYNVSAKLLAALRRFLNGGLWVCPEIAVYLHW